MKKYNSKIIAHFLLLALSLLLTGCKEGQRMNADDKGLEGHSIDLNKQAGEETSDAADSLNSESRGNIFVDSQDSENVEITDITIALPISKLHTEPNIYYDRLVAEINAYTGMNVTWEWYTNDTYYEELEQSFLSGDVADVVLVNRNEMFFSAAEQGVLWDLSPYLDEYDNLVTISELWRMRGSYEGKMYGIPAGSVKVQSLAYRQDWLEKLGLKEPTDWKSLCEMLYAFTYNDPDGDGVQNTVGLYIDKGISAEAWDTLECWLGVPDIWGIDENGDLIHKSQTSQYREAYAELRKLYADGVVNNGSNGIADFRQVEQWTAQLDGFLSGIAGSAIHEVSTFKSVISKLNASGMVGAGENLLSLSAVMDTGDGMKAYAGEVNENMEMLAISTERVKTESDLRKVLQFLNDVNDIEMSKLILYGWEGVTYSVDDNNHWQSLVVGRVTEDLLAKKNFRMGVGDILIGTIVKEEDYGFYVEGLENPLNSQVSQIIAEVQNDYVINYGFQFTSETEVAKGEDLEAMLYDAEIKYITGEIDDAGFEAALTAWWEAGGEAMTREKNERYHSVWP